MIPGDLLSAFPHRQFHTLPGLLDSWAALPNTSPNACMPMQGGSLYHCYDGLWYDPAERRTHDLPCERRTRYRLSQPDTVSTVQTTVFICIVCQLVVYQKGLYIDNRVPSRHSECTFKAVGRIFLFCTHDYYSTCRFTAVRDPTR